MNIIVIHNHVPDPNSSGADLRLFNVLLALLANGHEVTFAALSECIRPDLIEAIEAEGIVTFAGDRNQLHRYGDNKSETWSLKGLLREREYGVAILSLWFWTFLSMPEHYIDMIRSVSPHTAIAILTDDRHGERQQQIASLRGTIIDEECANDFAAREKEIYRRADLIIAIAERERQHAADCAPAIPNYVVPFSFPWRHPARTFEERRGLCFLANFSNPAGRETGYRLVRNIVPRIKHHIPSVFLTIAGPLSKEYFGNNFNTIRAIGGVSSLPTFFDAHRVFVSPIPFGTGIATKNVVAMAHGMPVVTSLIGAQSLTIRNGEELVFAETDEAISQLVVNVYTRRKLWVHLSTAAQSYTKRAGLTCTAQALREALAMLRRGESPNPDAPAQWSSRLFESREAIIGTVQQGVWTRSELLRAYIVAGFTLLNAQQPAEALAQFRHGISVVGQSLRDKRRFADRYEEMLIGISSCYEALGDDGRANACREELQRISAARDCSSSTAASNGSETLG